jgi:hypothetical protein
MAGLMIFPTLQYGKFYLFISLYAPPIYVHHICINKPLQSDWACFGLYPSSCMWKAKNTTTFRRLDLSPSSGGWSRINLLSWSR